MRALLILALAAAVLSLPACKKVEEAAVGAASGGTVQKDGDKTTIKTDQGDLTFTSGASQTLPANFPKDVFLPDGYTLKTTADIGGSTMVDLEAPGAPNDVFAQAQKAMTDGGWKQAAAMDSGGTKILVFDNGTHMAQYSFSDDGSGKTHLAVAVSAKGAQ